MSWCLSRRLRWTLLLVSTAISILAVSWSALRAESATRPGRVLLFTRTTGYRHASIEPAVASLQRAGAPHGLSFVTSEDVALFTSEGLAQFGAVVLLSTTGEPLGRDGGPIDALAEYVRRGGGLLAVHAATDAHGSSARYVQLLGGHFDGHPGDVRVATCRREGDHLAVARLPETFEVRDEYYLFRPFWPENRVVIRCTIVDGRGTIPVAWYREEGRGRVFYTCFGHTDETWTQGRLVQDHVVPALLWTLRR